MANIDYTQPYVNSDEYLEAKGIDLNIEIEDDDNKSRKVERFIRDLTDWTIDELIHTYCVNELRDFANLKEFRRVYFHKGMIEQIEYVISNGLISLDSGINKETGSILDFSEIRLGRNAFIKFRLGAFCNIPRG